MEYFGEEHEDGQRLLCFEYVQSSSYLVRLRLFAWLSWDAEAGVQGVAEAAAKTGRLTLKDSDKRQ